MPTRTTPATRRPRAAAGRAALLAGLGLLMAAVAALAVPAPPARAAAADESGPLLTVPEDVLDRSLRCPRTLAGAERPPVLLVHGTALDGRVTWDWNYENALPAGGFRFCTVDLPQSGMDEIQTATEHVVHAVRRMARESGRQVSVVGFSQGGLEPRWALRWWPDVQAKVADAISLSSPHRGTQDANDACGDGDCAPSIFQQRLDARFLGALNTVDETPGPAAYTSVYSLTDEIVRPQPRASTIAGASNVAVQDVCPGRPMDHNGTIYNPVVYALVLDALTNAGAADPGRVDRAVCTQDVMPGVDRTRFAANLARVTESEVREVTTYPQVRAEPQLACYVDPSGPARPCDRLRLSVGPARARAGRRQRFAFRVLGEAGSRPATLYRLDRRETQPVAGATVRFGGRRVTTDARGRASLTVRLPRSGRLVATAARHRLRPARRTVGIRSGRAAAPRFTG